MVTLMTKLLEFPQFFVILGGAGSIFAAGPGST
jgi:hypothetical protein